MWTMDHIVLSRSSVSSQMTASNGVNLFIMVTGNVKVALERRNSARDTPYDEQMMAVVLMKIPRNAHGEVPTSRPF